MKFTNFMLSYRDWIKSWNSWMCRYTLMFLKEQIRCCILYGMFRSVAFKVEFWPIMCTIPVNERKKKKI